MRKNIGGLDRIIRIVAGIALIAFAIPLGFPNTGWNWIGWFGIIPLLTAFVGFCPLYAVLGLSTCGKRSVTQR
jgi:hypothetical protein